MNVELLKDDHKRLLALCQKVEQCCLKSLSAWGIKSILALLKDFRTELEAHLVCEDKYLYPVLMQQSTEVGTVATRFKKEMGGLCGTLDQHSQRWDLDAAMADTTGFVSDLYDLLGSLKTRINKEEAILFPMLAPTAQEKVI